MHVLFFQGHQNPTAKYRPTERSHWRETGPLKVSQNQLGRSGYANAQCTYVVSRFAGQA